MGSGGEKGSDEEHAQLVREEIVRESDIVRSCLEALAIRGIFAHRNNTGAYTTEGGRYVAYGHPGSGDIIGILPFVVRCGRTDRGVFLAIECKTPKGRQSKKQRAYQRGIEKNQGVYLLVRSAKELSLEIDRLQGG